MTPEQRHTALSLGGRIGAHRRWSRVTDRAAETAPGTKAFLDRFEREVDPNGVMPSAERAKLAANARSAYFSQLALRSAAARRKRDSGRRGGAAA